MQRPLRTTFDAAGRPSWTLLDTGGRYVIDTTVVPGADRRRVAVLDRDLAAGEVYVEDAGGGQVRPANPVHYPLDQWIVSAILCRRGGLLLHAAGVVDHDQALVFAGGSGAGKTTMAGLWAGAGARVLSDDRVALRPGPEGFRAAGTPWRSRDGRTSPTEAPLAAVFLLRHAPVNDAAPARNPAVRLLPHAVYPFWEAGRPAEALATLSALLETTPCLDLGFVPDASVVEAVRAHLQA